MELIAISVTRDARHVDHLMVSAQNVFRITNLLIRASVSVQMDTSNLEDHVNPLVKAVEKVITMMGVTNAKIVDKTVQNALM